MLSRAAASACFRVEGCIYDPQFNWAGLSMRGVGLMDLELYVNYTLDRGIYAEPGAPVGVMFSADADD